MWVWLTPVLIVGGVLVVWVSVGLVITWDETFGPVVDDWKERRAKKKHAKEAIEAEKKRLAGRTPWEIERERKQKYLAEDMADWDRRFAEADDSEPWLVEVVSEDKVPVMRAATRDEIAEKRKQKVNDYINDMLEEGTCRHCGTDNCHHEDEYQKWAHEYEDKKYQSGWI